jgi:hypothetical protein
MHEKRPSASGVGETAKVFARQCQDNRVSGGSLENIKQNLWPRFRPVSHLWAAWDVAAAAKVDLLAPVGFFLFLGTAAWLLEECCQIVPKGARRPVLTVDAAWIVPEAIIDRGPDRGIRNRIPIATN